MKNLLLAHLGDWAVDKEMLIKVKDSIPAIGEFYAGKGVDDPKLEPLATEILREVYTCPIFSDNFCKLVKDEIQSMRFIPNADEDELRQIPEIILSDRLPEFYESLKNVVMSVINPIIWSIWQRTIDDVHVQVANYNPKGKVKGAWHHDHSSDITIVVPLNTGEYDGGGTEFFNRGSVHPLDNGHGLIFPGFTHLHRGLAVDSGDRYLLVFWLKVTNEE